MATLLPAILAAAAFAQDAPVPVEQEPNHKLLLKNEFIEVMRVTLPPDGRTLYHTHSHDRAAVELANTSITQQKWGEKEGEPGATKPGEISMSQQVEGGYSHRVHNVGKVIFEVLDFEFLQRPAKPSPPAIAPVVGENPSARAYRFVLAPGEKTPPHTHERPYLIVAATDIQLRMSVPDGQSSSHPVKAGDFHWVDTKVTHSLENAGTAPGEIVEFELK